MKLIVLCFVFLFSMYFVSADSFSINSPAIKGISQGNDYIEHTLNIISLENQNFKISFSSEADFLFIEEESFYLSEGESKVIKIEMNADHLARGIYSGKIIISGNEEIVVPVVLEKQDSFPIFDISTESSKNSFPLGENPSFDITVFRLKGTLSEAKLFYTIKNLEGDEFVSEEQRVTLRGSQLKISRDFLFSQSTEGIYVFSVLVRDVEGNSIGTSSHIFTVSPNVNLSPSGRNLFFVPILVVLFLVVAFVFFNHLWSRKLIDNSKDWRKKLSEIKNDKYSDGAKRVRKLMYQLGVLEKAYQRRYISKTSYDEGRKEIKALILKLKKRL